jgi:hypothetical protein
MITFKRILRFILFSIKKNPVKITMIICLVGLLYPININFYHEEKEKVVSIFKDGTNICYVIPPEEGSRTYKVLHFDKDQIISPDGYITTKDNTSFFLILAWFCFIVLFIVLFISSIINDADSNWNFSGVWCDVLYKDIVCEKEGNTYYYIIDNKLLSKSQTQSFGFSSILENYIDNPNLFMDFEGTTQRKRNNKLDKILN